MSLRSDVLPAGAYPGWSAIDEALLTMSNAIGSVNLARSCLTRWIEAGQLPVMGSVPGDDTEDVREVLQTVWDDEGTVTLNLDGSSASRTLYGVAQHLEDIRVGVDRLHVLAKKDWNLVLSEKKAAGGRSVDRDAALMSARVAVDLALGDEKRIEGLITKDVAKMIDAEYDRAKVKNPKSSGTNVRAAAILQALIERRTGK